MAGETDPPTERPGNLRASIDAVQADIVALRREIDFRVVGTDLSSKLAVEAVESLRVEHQKNHKREHQLQEALLASFRDEVHRIEREQINAIEKALESVNVQNKLHAVAHEREHVASQNAADKAEGTQQRAMDKSEAAMVSRMDQTNAWREQFNRQWTEQQATFAAMAGTLATRQMVEDKQDVAANDRDTLRLSIAKTATRELVDERQAATNKQLQEMRDWKLESQAQLRTWGIMMGIVVIVVNVAIRFL